MKHLPGIGAKTASQIILDLQGKLVAKSDIAVNDEKMKDVVAALKSLGYKTAEIAPVINKLKGEDLSLDAYIKKALALLLK